MLQLIDIRKSYTTEQFTQVALDEVSISFRNNEFVAILGPSGSGKTTLLNIIGGLDHYDSGNLIIDGIATERYKDRDWDAYRNKRIGFVFQSYNLIAHQTVLANVELALTLSGTPRAERRRRAVEALEQVGLEDHANKKPSQLSGGQMQRVAIARALINDPEILLADEPTGALDSKTSTQVMSLLSKIANDRLVIMVTHNPELAEKYANRTVNLADGVVCSDTHPYDPPAHGEKSAKPAHKTRMSFVTALSLSFNNLMTKKGRTLMTSFAGSIGIIGIAGILALANGVNHYIQSVEEETLSEYPLQINSQGVDLSSLLALSGSSTNTTSENANREDEAQNSPSDKPVQEFKMLTNLFSHIGSNDLASLKSYLDNNGGDMHKYTNSIQYRYNVTPQIFSADTSKGVHQVNPDTTFKSLGLGTSSSSSSLVSMGMNTNVFSEMMDDTKLVDNQYDVVAGHWPEKTDDLVLVLNNREEISDLMLYALDLRDPQQLKDMVNALSNNENVETPTDTQSFSYDQLMGKTFKLVYASDYYQYDDQYKVWKDKSDDNDYLKNLVDKGRDLKIAGIVKPKEGAKATALTPGFYYTSALTKDLIHEAGETALVQDQLANPGTNVISGKTFSDEANNDSSKNFDMSSLFTIDGQALQSAISVDPNALNIDLSHALNLQGALSNLPPAPQPNIDEIAKSLNISVPGDKVASLMGGIMKNYLDYLAKHPENPLTPEQYLQQASVQAQIAAGLKGLVDESDVKDQLSSALQNYVQSTMTSYMSSMTSSLQAQMNKALQSAMKQLSANMAHAMHIDEDAFKNAFHFNMNQKELSELMASFVTTENSSFDNNMKKFGYADMAKPYEIALYPLDFESKEHITNILDAYNQQARDSGDEAKVITYTDVVGTLMSSVTSIVNMISYVLVAFVAISLVVSSIMIGVITYISVLERKKEIGILRSIGASKGDISRVFNAETIIVGLVAGLLGISITALACIPANALVYSLFDVANVALLPWQAAVILILISMLLTLLAGLIPSRAASRKDPVEALRSE